MMDRRPSLLRRLTFFYTTLITIVLLTFTSAIAYVAFANVTRPEAAALAAATHDVESFVRTAPAGESLSTTQRRAVTTIHRDGVQIVPVPLDLGKGSVHRPPGDLSMGSLFGLYPGFVSVGNASIVVIPVAASIEVPLHDFLLTIGALAFLSLVAGFTVARLVARQTLKPLLTVTAELRRLKSGDFSSRPMTTTDLTELGDLAAAYNGAARQVTEAFLERRRVEDQIRQFVAEAGHELRTPLTVVAGYVDVLRRGGDADPEVRAASFESLRFELKRMRALVERLMTLARLDRPPEALDEIVDVGDTVGQVVDAVSVMSDVSIRYRARSDAFVRGEAGDVYEAAANLLENAIKYGEGSTVDVVLEHAGSEIVVRVCDGGPGIAEDHRSRIFERFYRATDRSEIAGSGLGLAIAAKAAERLKGRLELQDARPRSTTFALIVPAFREDAVDIG